MCHKLDPVFFKKLTEKDPAGVCGRSLAEYDFEKNVYRITAFGNEYSVNPEAHEVKPSSSTKEEVSVDLGLLILMYLLEAKEIPVNGEWVSEFNLRGGSMFFRGPHAFPVDEIAGRFGYDMEGFKKTCTNDYWQLSETENSWILDLAGSDYPDYYERQGGELAISTDCGASIGSGCAWVASPIP